MPSLSLLTEEWPLVLSLLPQNLDESVRHYKALTRKRKIKSGADLLRLGMAYGIGGLSLRETADWADLCDLTDLSDVALLNRLRNAADWFGWIVGQKLAQRHPQRALLPSSGRIRLLDATTVSRPASTGTDWRLHVGFDLQALQIDHVEITDARGGETLTRHCFDPGDLVICDRGYAHRAGIAAVVAQGAEVVVRLNWHNLPLQHQDATPLDLLESLRSVPTGSVLDLDVRTSPDPKKELAPVNGRLIALRKSKEATDASRKKIKTPKKGKTCDPRTLEAAEFMFVFTTLSRERMSGEAVLELYRFRPQIEIAFKQMKGIMFLDELQARDPALCRVFLLMKVLATLLTEDLQSRWASFSPWGYATPACFVGMEPSTRPSPNVETSDWACDLRTPMGRQETGQAPSLSRYAP